MDIKDDTTAEQINDIVTLEPVSDDELVTVSASRSYGWEGGGWGPVALRTSNELKTFIA